MSAKKKAKESDKDLLKRIRERYTVMVDADRENRRKALEDLKFINVPGEQWDPLQKLERGERACYEFNKIRPTVKRVINDIRANRPQGKVRAVEDSDKETAEVLEGLCRNIWNTSDGDSIIDNAAEFQVGGGMGAWRVETKYLSDKSFNQDIVVGAIKNPFCLYGDPAASDPLKRDGADWILTERISKASYESRWPNAEVIDFEESEFDDEEEWMSDETVRICEYWYKVPQKKVLFQTQDGRVISEEDAKLIPQELAQDPRTGQPLSRVVNGHKIMMCIASGDAILEKSTEWAGSLFPFVQIYGEWIVIDGKVSWFGLTRFAKDAQRAYNVARTASIEAVALAPNFKWWATPEQANGHTEKWGEAHKKNYPFMLYNSDPKAGGAPPTPMAGPQVPVALHEQSMIASDEIKGVTGVYDASLGAQGNETSGRAINARQQQGEIATFNYGDNLGKGIRLTWDILVDLAPKVYDTERQLRVLGVDGAEKYVKVNEVVQDPATGEAKTINDLSRGQFDVAITTGPSFATQRMEAADAYTAMATKDPALMAAAGDLVIKAMDLPYSEQIAERYKLMLPPQIQQSMADGKQMPAEVQAAMAQVQQQQQMVEQHGQMVQQAAEEADQKVQQASKAENSLTKLKAALEAQAAQFDYDRQMFEKDKELALQEITHAQETLALQQKLAGMAIQNKVTELHAHEANVAQQEQTAVQNIQSAHKDAQHGLVDAGHQQDMREVQHQMSAQDVAHSQDQRETAISHKAEQMKAQKAQKKPK